MRIEPLGDRAVQAVLGGAPDEATRRRILAASERVRADRLPGVVECVNGFTSLTLHYDPAVLSPERLEDSLRCLFAGLDEGEGAEGRVVEIPVCYGGEWGPDLAEVAALHGMPEAGVIELHAAGDYRVHMVGFLPGFPYLGGLHPALHTPRRSSPRTAVPAGSVGIGGGQTGVYPAESPGGWQLIGRTPLRLFDARRDPPALLRAGDRVRFVAIDAAAFRAWAP
jgi:inhibitor of KinA